MSMSIHELIKYVAEHPLTEEQHKELNKKARKECEEEAERLWRNRITQEDLNRVYSI